MGDFLDIYCERLGPGFWDEPFNALSNISFFLAAFFAWQFAKKENALRRDSWILIILLICIGAGSFAFHTLATETAQLADVLPILLYQISFLALYSANVMRANPRATGRLIFMFLLMTAAVHQVPDDVLNGSVAYLPALFFLTRFAVWHRQKATREPLILALAAGTFVVSLTFRTMDMQVCDIMPVGVHFLWHILNGFMLYLTARGYILNAKR